jgi:hypothetical protein
MMVSDAIRGATELMTVHGLIVRGWKLQLDNAVRRGGLCSHRKRVISLSGHFILLNEWEGLDGVKNLVLHEIAHALVGPREGHGPVWKAAARGIGCSGERCHAAKMPERQYVYQCPNGHLLKRHRRARPGIACGRCCKERNGGRYSAEFVVKLVSG